MVEEIDLLASFAGKGGKKESTAMGRARFQASIVTTYNAYLPFYEDVVLRRLVASGCHHNVLLVDASRFVESLETPTARPRLAGRAYTLVPMRAPAAFHPKIGILVGKKQARMFVGSHNMTLSGFGKNREVSTKFDLPRGKADENAAVVAAAWSFLEEWLQYQSAALPKTVIDSAFRVATRFAPWLRERQEQTGETAFRGSHVTGESLWGQFRSTVRNDVRRVVVIGAFFDHKFEFLKTLQDELNPRQLIVGVEPDKVVMGNPARRPTAARFVDASQIGRGDGYVHAKAILVEQANGEQVVVTGSANPSRPAWTGGYDQRNAEAVVVHTGRSASLAAERLELAILAERPDLSDSIWSAIEVRLEATARENQRDPGCAIGVAVVEEEGLRVSTYPDSYADVCRATGFRANDSQPVFESDDVSTTENGIWVATRGEDMSGLAFVDLSTEGGNATVRAFVHDSAAIARLSRSSSQQRLREALDSLDEGSPDIATVIRLAGKLIFDGEAVEEVKTRQSSASRSSDKEEVTDEKPVNSLIVEFRGTKKYKQRIRELRAGDLGYIIDTLIYRLGIGLRTTAEQFEQEGPSEEEQIGADEDAPSPAEEVSTADIVNLCHSKVRTLVSRMLRQLARAHDKEVTAISAVEQLLAVLAVLREVRRQDERLMGAAHGEGLFAVKERRRLLDGALTALFERRQGLYVKVLPEYDNDPDGDLARLRGLLLWLAWGAGLDARRKKGFAETRKEEQERLIEQAKLLTLTPLVAADDVAEEEARRSICGSAGSSRLLEAQRWLDAHLRWGAALHEQFDARGTWDKAVSTVRPGSMAVALKEPVNRLRLLMWADGGKAQLLDLGEKRGGVPFSLATVVTAELPAIH